MNMITQLCCFFTRVRNKTKTVSSKITIFHDRGGLCRGLCWTQWCSTRPNQTHSYSGLNKPQDALNLSSFLGLTGHFQDLIKNYAKLEHPLQDLIRSVELPPNCSKATYRRIMVGHKLDSTWTLEHDKAFIHLKAMITTEPVLKAQSGMGLHLLSPPMAAMMVLQEYLHSVSRQHYLVDILLRNYTW